MIENQLQYRVTTARLRDLREMLQALPSQKVPPKTLQVRQNALESLIEELEQDLQAYERLQTGQAPDLSIFENLAETLIKARIAAGLTHAGLAELLNMKPQQVQRYESTKYASASLERLMQVARAIQAQQPTP